MATVPRSRAIRLAIGLLTAAGILIAFILWLIFVISLSFKDNTFVAWTLLMWFLALWLSIGMSLAVTLQPKKPSSMVSEIIVAVAWLIALVFAFAGTAFITFIWGKCTFDQGGLDAAEIVACKGSQEWVLWLLWIFGLLLLFLTAIGFAIHVYDWIVPRLGTLTAAIPFAIGQNGNGAEAEKPEGAPSVRRSGLLRLLIALVGILGIAWVFVALILYLVTVGIKDTTFVSWFLNPWYIPFWMAAGISTMMVFLPVARTKGLLEIGAVIVWLVAFVFTFVGMIFYIILWVRCPLNKGSTTDGEKAICSNEDWLIWILFFASVVIAIHSLVGLGVHLWDYISTRRRTIEGLVRFIRPGGGGGGGGGAGAKLSLSRMSGRAGAKAVSFARGRRSPRRGKKGMYCNDRSQGRGRGRGR